MNVSAAARKHWSLAVNQWSGGAASSSTNRTATSVWSFDRSDRARRWRCYWVPAARSCGKAPMHSSSVAKGNSPYSY